VSVASWFRFAKFHFSAVETKLSRRRVPTRPFLEQLEERAVPDAASANVLGNLNNATLNANLPTSGLVLAPSLEAASLNAVALSTFLNGLATLNLGQQTSGLANVLSNVPTSIFFSSLGFGSGTQPNQPWVPNAYNLGLANGQFSFPSMADFGSFQNLGGIRYPRISRLPQPNNDANRPEQLLPPRDALASTDVDELDTPEAVPQEKETDIPAEEWIDSDSDPTFRPIPILPHTPTVDVNVFQAGMKKPSASVERTPPEVRFAAVGSENATEQEQLPQAGSLTSPEAHGREENVFAYQEPEGTAAEGQFLDSDLLHDVPALETLNLPSTLLLTVLTPAQLMVLLAEFPVGTVPSERGEDLAEYSERE
jgi:hypothetical protein